MSGLVDQIVDELIIAYSDRRLNFASALVCYSGVPWSEVEAALQRFNADGRVTLTPPDEETCHH